MTKIILSAVLAVILGVAIWGAYQYPQFGLGAANTNAAAGALFGDAKMALISWSPGTNAATSTSILNPDGSDRIIKSVEYWCGALTTVNGAPLALWLFTSATTTTNSQGLQGNTNYVLTTSVATTTAELWVSSSTPGLTATNDFRRWPANSYLTFNANASSTGNCTIGVLYNPT